MEFSNAVWSKTFQKPRHRFYKLGELLAFSSLISLSFRVTFFRKVPNCFNYLTEYEKGSLGYILGPKKGVSNGPLGGCVC